MASNVGHQLHPPGQVYFYPKSATGFFIYFYQIGNGIFFNFYNFSIFANVGILIKLYRKQIFIPFQLLCNTSIYNNQKFVYDLLINFFKVRQKTQL